MTNQVPAPTCPDCGTLLPEDSPRELCPSCLMRQALASRTVLEPGPEPSSTPPPSPEEMADKFPQFEITECLGRGGMGVVYKARQKSLDRWVAIKILAPERVGDGRFAERFAREAQTLACLSHPNIVTVFDYGETDGLYYIVMEFVDGVNLRDLLREGTLDPQQALSIVPPVCEALQYAHDKGIVHRDIKPENLLLDRDGRIKIADFGIASLVGASGEQSGTPPYMAPEQGEATSDIDHRADIYALGAVLYETLTGERPGSPLELPSHKVQIDIRIDDIVLRALNKEPERRYRTADEFRTMVETIASTPSPPAVPSGPVPPGSEPSPRLSGMAVTGAVLQALPVVLILLLSILAHFLNTSSGPGVRPIIGFGALSILLLILFSVPGCVLGWVAAARIRASPGQLRGMGFAVFAAMTPVTLLTVGFLLAAGTIVLRLCLAVDQQYFDQITTILIGIVVALTGLALLSLILGACFRHLRGTQAQPRQKRRRLVALTLLVLWIALGGLLWIQRPRQVDSWLASQSENSQYDAMGSTWHRMRVFGGDRLTYRFVVQGKGGSVFKKREIPVPVSLLANDSLVPPNKALYFGEKGNIRWHLQDFSVEFCIGDLSLHSINL